MQPLEHRINVSRTARFYTVGDIGSNPSDVWFVLHGYGYLARQFIRYFRVLAAPHRLIVAPEGLSRFYVDHEERRAGASWMTSEDRLCEIADYVGFLDELYRQLGEFFDRSKAAYHVLGFSQGAATACRWVVQGRATIDRLTIWSGLVPPDVDLATGGAKLREARLTIVIGDKDEFVDAAGAAAQVIRLKELGILHQFVSFDGGHRIDKDQLLTLADGGI